MRRLLLVLSLLASCREVEPVRVVPEPRMVVRPEVQPTRPTLPAEAALELEKGLVAYEAARVALTADRSDGLAAAGADLGRVLTAVADGAGAPELQALARDGAMAAGDLGEGGIDASRAVFGKVSRAVVGLVAAAPPLRSRHHVFICPMAEGYQKWVQPSAELENPYMGTRMLRCGSASVYED